MNNSNVLSNLTMVPTSDGWCPDCGQPPEICARPDSQCPNQLASESWVNDKSQSLTLTKCTPDFLQAIRRKGEVIDFNILEIAIEVRGYVQNNKKEIEAYQVYYEVATYSLHGRRPRTVRDWVEGIMGYPEKAIWNWYNAGLTMAHFKAARKLCRDGHVDNPSDALDACINEREHHTRPLTVEQMETLFNPPKPANQQIAEFRDWLSAVLKRKPPFGWNQSKIEKFCDWQQQGKEFLK